jgi:tetratricopeptide (TPR) repeat protein
MRCPNCDTENRDDRDKCYHCGQDLRMLRLIINKSKHHYNLATEHVEREAYADALKELDSALELDARFADARVLRGTVLVRLERTTEALEEWQLALALNPALARASRYISELPQVAKLIPAIRRMNWIAAGVVLVVVVSIGAGVYVSFPSRSERGLDRAFVALGHGNLQGAAAELGDVSNRLAPDSRLAKRRESLVQAIRRIEDSALAEAAAMIAEGRYETAAAALDRLEEMHPTADAMAQVTRARRQMVSSLEERVAELLRGDLDEASFRAAEDQLARLEALSVTTEDHARLRQELSDALRRSVEKRVREMIRGDVNVESLAAAERHLEKFTELALTPADADRLRADMRLAARGTLNRRLTDVDSMMDEGADPTRTRAVLEEAASLARIVGDEEGVALRRANLARVEASEPLQRARKALESDDVAMFEQSIATLRAIPFLPGELTLEADALRDQFEERQRQLLLAAFERASAVGDYTGALEMAKRVRAAGVELPEGAEEMLREAARRVALDAYYALMGEAARIERGEITSQDAQEILARVQVAGTALPERYQPRLTNDLEFFAAVALRELGRTKEAADRMEALEAKHPDSPYLLRWRELLDASTDADGTVGGTG